MLMTGLVNNVAIRYINKGTLFTAFYNIAPYLSVVFLACFIGDRRYVIVLFSPHLYLCDCEQKKKDKKSSQVGNS